MKEVFAYIRVSTARQGEHGVSLQEQRDAIQDYARRMKLEIREWFEERQTAAKRGRPVFGRMLTQLSRQRVTGLIIHKIDRSARNLKDWADLGELIDRGVEVHLAHDSLDLASRGGRLTADIQAVIAADHIRNLREETRKGFYGRLKQGLYPRPAPLGYIDVGPGQPKTPDPIRAPLIHLMFELYASGRFGLRTLSGEMRARGLRNKAGNAPRLNQIADMLKNPFYVGLCRIEKSGQTFEGRHAPLVPKSLFDRVQDVLRGKSVRRVQTHAFPFRRLLRCVACQRHLIGERQKGHIYYRCHSRECRGTSVRQEAVDSTLRRLLRLLTFSPPELDVLQRAVDTMKDDFAHRAGDRRRALLLQQKQLDTRLARLTDALVDGLLDRDLFEQRKTALQLERRNAAEQLEQLDCDSDWTAGIRTMLELANGAHLLYEQSLDDEKRELLNTVMSNLSVHGKSLVFTLRLPFSEIATRQKLHCGSPDRDRSRTSTSLEALLQRWLNDLETAPCDTVTTMQSLLRHSQVSPDREPHRISSFPHRNHNSITPQQF